MVDLSKIIKPDGVLPVFYNGLKAIISHDSDYDQYRCIVVDITSISFCNCYGVNRFIDEEDEFSNIIPRKGMEIVSWQTLLNDKSYEPDF